MKFNFARFFFLSERSVCFSPAQPWKLKDIRKGSTGICECVHRNFDPSLRVSPVPFPVYFPFPPSRFLWRKSLSLDRIWRHSKDARPTRPFPSKPCPPWSWRRKCWSSDGGDLCDRRPKWLRTRSSSCRKRTLPERSLPLSHRHLLRGPSCIWNSAEVRKSTSFSDLNARKTKKKKVPRE